LWRSRCTYAAVVDTVLTVAAGTEGDFLKREGPGRKRVQWKDTAVVVAGSAAGPLGPGTGELLDQPERCCVVDKRNEVVPKSGDRHKNNARRRRRLTVRRPVPSKARPPADVFVVVKATRFTSEIPASELGHERCFI